MLSDGDVSTILVNPGGTPGELCTYECSVNGSRTSWQAGHEARSPAFKGQLWILNLSSVLLNRP